ncbi:MAG TPA: lysophospholipid acyltransferase family protein [Mycobacterium sp.]|nr:lysophospholipid acyltransferase family protein [Mycobacterium sp.]
MSTETVTSGHAWFPVTSCDARCVVAPLPNALGWLRPLWRLPAAVLLLIVLPVLTIPVPGNRAVRKSYCRLLLRSLGVRLTVTGDPVRKLPGVLVVSNHMSWSDVLVIGAVLPGTFVARADLVDWPLIGWAARLMNVISIDRARLRSLPEVVAAVAQRLRDGRTVIAFPEGTTHCGPDRGRFHPAVFQSAVDTGRPVQPLHLRYRYRDGTPSTATAFLGADSLWASLKRVTRTRSTIAEIAVLPLQLPDGCRRELATRCEEAVRPRAPLPARLSTRRTVDEHLSRTPTWFGAQPIRAAESAQ